MGARFEAMYFEDDDCVPEWCVVEWNVVNPNGSKSGNTVWKSYDMVRGEIEAVEMAAILQHEYDAEFHAEFG